MSKNDPIFCFNGSECIYTKCGMFDNTVSICGIERLKTVQVRDVTKPSQVQAEAGRVQVSQTPFVNPPLPQTSAQKIAGANKKPSTNCANVTDGMKGVKVHGKLAKDPIFREVNTAKGPTKIEEIMLDDGTAELRITFWNLGKVPELKAGDEVTIDSLMGKAPYNGVPQASGGDYVKIEKV